MAFEVSIDASAFEEMAKRLDGSIDQLPFALSKTLNDAAFAARTVLVQSTWPRHVQQRNASFIGASLRVERATKGNLTAGVYDQLGNRGHLLELARGGTVTPTRSRVFAIPVSSDIRRGARGVRQQDRPRNLVSNNRRAVRVTSKGIFIGKGGRLQMVYAFKPSVTIPKRVPFYSDFSEVIVREMAANFASNVAYAMATRK